MSIFNRIKTNVRADAHGLIDALEDRRLLLKQCVRDAEAELVRKRAKLQLLEQDLRQLEREEKATASELSSFELDARTALAAGNDELSRYALKAVLVRRARQRRQVERREELSRAQGELTRTLAEQSERFEALKERVNAELLAESGEGPGARAEVVTDEQVELELLRRKAQAEVAP
jgi:phage shock protein A